MGRHSDQTPNAQSANARSSNAQSASVRAARDKDRLRELAHAHRTYRANRYRSLVMHWMGRWLRRPKRANVTPLPSVVPGQVGISFSGHATVLLRYASRNIVCDPMLGKWVKGVKRSIMPGLTPADLHDVDIILISHAHQDHLHRPTLATMPKSATVILPPRTAQLVSDLGFARVVELSPDQSIQDHGVDIATAAVKHGDEAGATLSYVIRGDGPSVYFCGDSGYFPGFADIGEKYAPDIALLPIGGYAPLSFRERHMSPLDALYALDDLGSRIMIPIHHGAFTLSYERLDEPIRWLAELVEERGLQDFVVPLEPGESRIFVPPGEQRVGQPRNSGESQRVGSGAGIGSPGSLAAAERAPDSLQALPATRALTPPDPERGAPAATPAPSTSGEPAWVRGRLPQFADAPAARPAFDLALARAAAAGAPPDTDDTGESIAIPETVEGTPTDPMAAPELFPAIDAALDEVEASEDVPAEAPEELVVEQISSVHSTPIELAPKRAAGSSAEQEAAEQLLPDAAFDELEALVAARFTDNSAPIVASTITPTVAPTVARAAIPFALLADERTDRQQMRAALEHSSAPDHRILSRSLTGVESADDDLASEPVGDSLMDGFDLHAALRDHFERFPDSRLRARLESEDDCDSVPDELPDEMDERVSDSLSGGHRLEPIPAFA